MKKDAIAILWDIENVTPSTNTPFVKGLLEYAREIGRISVARAYGDWTRPGIKNTAKELAEESFEMLHIPRSKKNSSDIALGTQAVELIYQFPHLRKLVLVTGDADFRPVLQAVRKHDIESIIICDAKSASEDLLLMADEYKDFRDLTEAPSTAEHDDSAASTISKEESYRLLQEAINYMTNQNRMPSLGAVKIRMKLLNESFDEQKLGFKSWKAYVLEAEKRGYVQTAVKNQDLILSVPKQAEENKGRALPNIIFEFLRALGEEAKKTRGDKTKRINLSAVGHALRQRKIDYRQHGYSKLKKLADAVEKRGLVNTTVEGSDYLLELTEKGTEFLS
jgi:uncharacterized LabA/DUF88 family protein